MFNKKLKKRLKCLESELGYSYDVDYYENLEHGDIAFLRSKFRALEDYLDVENIGGYDTPKFKERKME